MVTQIGRSTRFSSGWVRHKKKTRTLQYSPSRSARYSLYCSLVSSGLHVMGTGVFFTGGFRYGWWQILVVFTFTTYTHVSASSMLAI